MQEQGNEQSGTFAATGEASAASWPGEGRAAETAAEVGRQARRAKDEAASTLREAREKAAVAYDRTAETATRAYRGARDYAQRNPGMAAGLTFAAGVGVGMMMSARNGLHVYRKGLVPVVAIALAQAVLDVFDERR